MSERSDSAPAGRMTRRVRKDARGEVREGARRDLPWRAPDVARGSP
jgi:hypothetical protein